MNQQSETFIQLRPYLFKIAYNMTGEVEEAEDIVQDVFEKWLKISSVEVKSAKAYLARVVVNRSIDRLNELKLRRETYTGYWLPEPYISLETETTEPGIDYGLLFLLQRLNPVERAVFILRESFSENYEAIAEITGQTVVNCRQLHSRSREKLRRETNRRVDPEKQRRLTEAFLLALHQQDRSVLEGLLRTDIELYNDGGGKRVSALKPLFGFETVQKFLYGILNSSFNKDEVFTYQPAFINGLPAALLYRQSTGELDTAIVIDTQEDNISRLLFIRNPDKLKIRQ